MRWYGNRSNVSDLPAVECIIEGITAKKRGCYTYLFFLYIKIYCRFPVMVPQY